MRRPIILRFCCCLALTTSALWTIAQSDTTFVPSVPQQEKKWNLKDRLITGGGLGAAFGNTTFIQASPQLGLRLKENSSVGIGANYMYIKTQGFRAQSMYGWSVWGRQFVTNNIFTMIEFEQLNREVFDPRNGFSRRNVPMLFVGGGIFTGQRQGFGMSLQIMYDLIGDPYSPYINPVIRVGGAFGF